MDLLIIKIFVYVYFLEAAAISLGKRDDLVKKAVAWCATEDDAGVQGEANRLIAWLVIHSRYVNEIQSNDSPRKKWFLNQNF